MNPGDLVRIARYLANGAAGGNEGLVPPNHTDLCRSVSTAYYALFHTLAGCCADMLAGDVPIGRSHRAWRQIYRSLEHGHARNQCENEAVMRRFPEEIQTFGNLFIKMQRARHLADYDPDAEFSQREVSLLIGEVERGIEDFNTADPEQLRNFAIYVLFRNRQ